MTLADIAAAFQAGQTAEATAALQQWLLDNPQDEAAWVLRMVTEPDSALRYQAAQRVLMLNPANPQAAEVIRLLQAQGVAEPIETFNPPASAQTGGAVEGIFEMLWDCDFCGAIGLLGRTNRFCPNCGAGQRAEKRYFPSEAQMVAVREHLAKGADRACPSCATLNANDAKFCVNCGMDLAGVAEVKTAGRRERAEKDAPFATGAARDLVKEKFDEEQNRLQRERAERRPLRWVAGLGGLLLCVGLGVGGLLLCVGLGVGAFFALTATRQTSLVVTGHEWRREIQIQAYQAVPSESWCDAMPVGAYAVTRSERQRGTRQVPDGEDCRMVQVDNGDGTFRQVRECTPRFRSEPVYADYCRFTLDTWVDSREVVTQGRGLTPPPYWGEVTLRGGTGLGREREGERIQEYRVLLRETGGDNKAHTCAFDDMTRWTTFGIETRWQGEVSRLTGRLDCDELTR